MSIAAVYADRRERVCVQVLYRWLGDAEAAVDDGSKMQAVEDAADMTFQGGINDLDWEEATLRYLR